MDRLFIALILWSVIAGAQPINIPAHIYINLYAFKGESLKLNIQKEKMLIRHYIGGAFITDSGFTWCEVSLEPNEYVRILNKIAEIGVFQWKPRYMNPHVKDGAGFEVVIYEKDKLTRVRGSNKFPDNFGELEALAEGLVDKYACSSR